MKLKLTIFFCFMTIAHTHFIKRIIGGNNAEPHAFPNVVAVYCIQAHRNAKSMFYSGTIYNSEWISVTGACVSKIGHDCSLENVRVVAGKWNLSEPEPFQQVRAIVQAYIHKDFDAVHWDHHDSYNERVQSIKHLKVPLTKSLFGFGEPLCHQNIGNSTDLGLLQLNETLRFNEYVTSMPFSMNRRYPSGVGLIVGWGSSTVEQAHNKRRSDILNFLTVHIVNIEACKFAIKTMMEKEGLHFVENSFNAFHFCTGTFTNTTLGPSYGDSGGPLMQLTIDGEVEVVGLISAGVKHPNLGLYIHVSHFVRWIETKIRWLSSTNTSINPTNQNTY